MVVASITRSTMRLGAAVGSVYLLRALLQRAGVRQGNQGLARGKRVLIVGGGFAGVGAAQALARLLPGSDNGEITLIDRDNYLLFTPMLTEAAGGDLDRSFIVSPLRDLEPRVRFLQGSVQSLDLKSRSVVMAPGAGKLTESQQQYEADHLVIALGSVNNTRHTPGVAEFAIPMKRLDDARRVFERVSACLEQASTETDAAKRKELLTFVVAGGGYTGVETMAAMNDLIRTSARKWSTLSEDEVRTVIVDPAERLLPELSAELAAYATKKLRERQVEVRLKMSVAGVTENAVQFEGGESLPARTLVWAAGVTPNPLIEGLPAEKGKHHGLKVNGCMQVPHFEGVWALGDCAEIPEPDGHGAYAPTAQNATREGKQVAENIVAVLHGREPKAFRYTPIGELALVGRRAGVARVYGVNVSGFLAWAMWRAVYLAKMPKLSQRGRILGSWLLDLTFGRAPVPLSSSVPEVK